MWLGDVGENAWEEIDTVNAGKNYGWPDYEGPSCNPNASANHGGTAGCDALTSVAPRYAYRHDGTTAAYGDCVVGGFVYRGSNLPDLVGSVVFSDCITGTIWALKPDANGNPNIFVTLGATRRGRIGLRTRYARRNLLCRPPCCFYAHRPAKYCRQRERAHNAYRHRLLR